MSNFIHVIMSLVGIVSSTERRNQTTCFNLLTYFTRLNLLSATFNNSVSLCPKFLKRRLPP